MNYLIYIYLPPLQKVSRRQESHISVSLSQNWFSGRGVFKCEFYYSVDVRPRPDSRGDVVVDSQTQDLSSNSSSGTLRSLGSSVIKST